MKRLVALALTALACTEANDSVQVPAPDAGEARDLASGAETGPGPADAAAPDAPGLQDSALAADAHDDATAPDPKDSALPADTAMPVADAAEDGPRVYFHVRTTTAPFPHADGLSGQTARAAFQGIRSFALFEERDAPPLVVVDLEDEPVEAGYNDGDDTLIASAPAARIRPGRYRYGRNIVTHSRYVVDAVMHVGGLAVPGEFDNIQVLSTGTVIDGEARPQGWFRYIFRAVGREFPLEGTGAPLPTDPTTGGFRFGIEDGVAFYDYPLDLVIEERIQADLHVILQVNMDHAFRWEDQLLPAYLPGVFDSTPQGSEPVRRFGANSLEISTERR